MEKTAGGTEISRIERTLANTSAKKFARIFSAKIRKRWREEDSMFLGLSGAPTKTACLWTSLYNPCPH